MICWALLIWMLLTLLSVKLQMLDNFILDIHIYNQDYLDREVINKV